MSPRSKRSAPPAADLPLLQAIARSAQPAPPPTAAEVADLRRSLLTWYHQQGRDLPWRNTRDPYAIWISEIMLQQTQVKTVIPYYQRWLAQFPTVERLAAADQQSVLKTWEGLGYYARARNLHRAAQDLVERFGGRFPRTLAEAISLPGIGQTTAGGILSAAFNLPTPILDGNVKRVLARLSALATPPAKALPQLWDLSGALLDPQNPRDFNQALMDLGATGLYTLPARLLWLPLADSLSGLFSRYPSSFTHARSVFSPSPQADRRGGHLE